MADEKVSAYTECTDPKADDDLYIIDQSEALDANKSKRVKFVTLISMIVVNNGEVVCNNGEVVII